MYTRTDLATRLVRGNAAGLRSWARERRRTHRVPLPASCPLTRDPLGPDVMADPHPWYRELHGRGPVHYNEDRAVWILSGYDAVRAAARAHDQLSSAESVTPYRFVLPMMLTVDRPEHERLRRMVAREFTNDALDRWRPTIQELAAEAVGRLEGAGADAVGVLAAPLPVTVIAHLLGVPARDMGRFRAWSDRIVEGFALRRGPVAFVTAGSVLRAVDGLRRYLDVEFRRARAGATGGIVSRLAQTSDEGRLTEEELFWFVLLLLVAGNETTTNLIGTLLASLAEHPGQYELLRRRPELRPSAIEETLRHGSPIQGFYRTAVQDYRAGSFTIPAGARVLLLYAAANRDPDHYPDPDRFDVERNPRDHLGFGSGIHFCLGAHLTRIEGAAVLDALTARAGGLELIAPPAWSEHATLRGPTALRVRLAA